MNWNDLQSLDFDNAGEWPQSIKSISALFLASILGFLGYQLDIKNLDASKLREEQREQELKSEFETKQTRAANLNALKIQLSEMKKTLGDMLKRLPDKSEVANLLVDISQQGLGSGLEFELFKPDEEKPRDFYYELPIQIRVSGNYHQFGQFISGVADLSRIVTQHNVKISTQKDNLSSLVMETTAKTYRYIEDPITSAAPSSQTPQ